ncbi:flagellar type III secretion system pore protein FliP [Limnobacter sp.]|uniref:flagellar type III secretion system pore protein FliP n=1 Tax=Limnobacter sp. TaxID=2003368 RepID=UPI003512733F
MRKLLASTAVLGTALLVLLLGAVPEAQAQQVLPGVTATPGPNGSTNYSVPSQTLLFFTFLSFLPALILMMTGFTRIVIVMSLLRMALGTQNSPPNQVIIGLSLFLTFFVMSPVFDRVYTEAYQPFAANEIPFEEMTERASVPMKDFMLKQTREPDLALFMRLGKVENVQNPEDVPLKVLIPAFVTSELKTAFQIGFMIFLPFLVIDLIVSSVLMSMGMMMLSPMLISLPFKIMLFVLVDGWTLLVGSLVASFET